MEFPDDRRYAKTHEWARREGEAVVVGISDYAQDQLGDIVYVELPDVGTRLARGDGFGVIESVKAVADLYAPVGGEVVAVNAEVTDDMDAISQDPYGRGWLVRLRASDPSELEMLMDAAAYRKHCEEDEQA
jgi:glycine cleavage system H protein